MMAILRIPWPVAGHNEASMHELAAPEERAAPLANAAGLGKVDEYRQARLHRVRHRGLSQQASVRAGVVEPHRRAGAQRLSVGAIEAVEHEA